MSTYDDETPSATDPIPQLCAEHTVSLLTGASHTGRAEYAMSLVSDLLDGRGPGNRSVSIPSIGWLTITHGNPIHARRALLNTFLSRNLSHVWNSPRFAARAISVSEISGHADEHQNACALTPTVLSTAFAGAFGTSPRATSSTLAIPRFLILDDIHRLLLDESPNSPKAVTRLMQGLTSNLVDANTTVLAFSLMTKLKAGDRFRRVPDRILGSGAWGVEAHTVWLVDIEDDDDKRLRDSLAPKYQLQIALRNGDLEQYTLEPDSRGLLIPHSLDALAAESIEDSALRWLDLQHDELTTSVIIARFESAGASRASAERFIRTQRASGRLQSVKKGVFRVVPVC